MKFKIELIRSHYNLDTCDGYIKLVCTCNRKLKVRPSDTISSNPPRALCARPMGGHWQL